MRRLIAASALWLLALPAAAERIRAFDVDVTLERDGRFWVEERITYDFEGVQRHGIYRDIPVRYERGFGGYHVKLDAVRVSDADDNERPAQLSRRGVYQRIRIGDPNRKVSGVQTYVLRYRVARGLLFFDDYDELYWNATGTEWEVPIDAARVRVWLPEGVATDALRLGCFTGPFGSRETECAAVRDPAGVRFLASRAFGPGEGISVALALPKGVVPEPSAWEQVAARIGDSGAFWLLAPLATLVLLWRRWRTTGRDPQLGGSIPVRYEPPEGLTPAEVGVLADERADLEDVTATILDLAVRGYLVIEEEEGRRFLFFTEKDYRLRRKRSADEDLKGHEQKLHRALFESGGDVLVSSLRNEFYEKLPGIKKKLYRQLSGAGRYFAASPEKVTQGWRVAGVAVLLGSAMLLGVPFMRPMGVFAVGSCGLLMLAFAKAMPRRTRKGRRAYEEILGFQEFVSRVDADRLARMGGMTSETFERVLPFAVVLGVGDAWADAFADIYRRPPDWYHSAGGYADFHPRAFVSDVGRGLGTIGRTLASQPRGSGSSGSGGGGGFSGGGMGGGGGGSW